MGKFLPGLFVGAAIGLLIAPKKGEEMRLELTERWKQLQNKLSGVEPATIHTSTSTARKTDPITLPVDSLESARPTSSPMSANETSSSSFSKKATNSASSTTAIPAAPTSTAAPISTTMPPKPFKLNDSVEDDESAPITTPVETFEETTPLESNTSTNTSSSKLNTSYRNPGKSNTASRWPNNNNQHK